VCVAEPDEDDAVLAGEGVQPIQGQEASPDVQGANVQVCFNESTNKKITFRTFRSVKSQSACCQNHESYSTRKKKLFL
jgi:hypothetical protein